MGCSVSPVEFLSSLRPRGKPRLSSPSDYCASQECWGVQAGPALCAHLEHRNGRLCRVSKGNSLPENRDVRGPSEFSPQRKGEKGSKRKIRWVALSMVLKPQDKWVRHVILHSCRKSEKVYVWLQSFYSSHLKLCTWSWQKPFTFNVLFSFNNCMWLVSHCSIWIHSVYLLDSLCLIRSNQC